MKLASTFRRLSRRITSSVEVPFVLPWLTLRKSVAIVGSSGRLSGAGLGAAIDASDEVIRFNRAPTDGFESDVGAKTTLRLTNNHVFGNVDIQNQGFSRQPPNFVKDLRDARLLFVGPDLSPWEQRYNNTHASCQLYLFDYSKMNALKRCLPIRIEKNLLVGSVGICLCIAAGIVPKLYGFDLEAGPRTHYFEERPVGWNDTHHSPGDEQIALRRLTELGKIKIVG